MAFTSFKQNNPSSFTPASDILIKKYQEDAKAGTNFTGDSNAPFQSEKSDTVLDSAGKAVGNLPSSTFGLIKNIANAVMNPVDTANSIKTLAEGAGAKIGQVALENTDIGQKILDKANEVRVSKGLDPLQKDASGKYEVEHTPQLDAIDQVGKFFADRYGNIDNFKKTAIEDPAGVLSDVATLLSGAGVALKGAGLANIANKVSEVSKVIEPITAITKTASNLKNIPGAKTVSQVLSDISPTSEKVQQGQIVKALELTPGDLSGITKKTGNDVTKFIVDNNLIKSTPEEVAQATNDLRKAKMAEVRSEIAKIADTYTPDQVPNVKKGLDVILKGVEDVPGLENEAKIIKELSQKTEYTLSDIQQAKELIDENTNIYSKLGSVKETSQAKGLDNIRGNLKEFIEKEVEAKTNGKTSIKNLNNEVQTSYAIEDAIKNRAMRGMTRQHISAFDVLIATGGTAINPFLGAGLLVGKKVLESPTTRLVIAKALNKFSPEKVATFTKDITANKLSPSTQQILKNIADKLKNTLAPIESASAVLDNQSKVNEVNNN